MQSTYGALAASLASGVLGEGTGGGVPVVTGCTIRTSRRTAESLKRRLVRLLEDCRDAEREDGEVEMRLLALHFDGPGSAEA